MPRYHTVFEKRQATVYSSHSPNLILPAAVVATGPDDAVLKELAALLLQLLEVGLRVEDVVDNATERWSAAPIDSER